MIEKWFEPFMLLEAAAASDKLGSERLTFTDDMPFRGALTCTAGKQSSIAGQFVLEESPVLLHEFDVSLLPGDHVRREKDGAVYRVTGRSDSMRSPAWSGLRFGQVSVERVVQAC